jgi:hypothetical protein
MQNTSPQFLELSQPAKSMAESIEIIHSVIASRYSGVDRVAMAVYDAGSDMLKTFVSSNHDGMALIAYEAKLESVPSLQSLAKLHQSRVVQDIEGNFPTLSRHGDWLKDKGYLSSYTVPIYQRDTLAGFVFLIPNHPISLLRNLRVF